MRIHPMIAALARHKAGVLLISLQIALTLAIVINAIFIIGERIARVDRPTGLAENDLLLVTQQWVGAPSIDSASGIDKLAAKQREDLAALRAVPGVVEVAPINAVPLLDSSWNGGVAVMPDVTSIARNTRTTFYFSDQSALATLGVELIAGRNFTADEIKAQSYRDPIHPAVVIITEALAEKIFPSGDALGKSIYLNGGSEPVAVIGIVRRLQTPSMGSWASGFAWNSVLVPRVLSASSTRFAIRTQPGAMADVAARVPQALYAVDRMRVLDEESIRTFAEIRAEAYRADVGMAILMGIICVILVAVTAAGIVGLTSFWVGQRHRQIGVRRALGARKVDILRYFQIENLAIAGSGVALGIVLAIGINQWMMERFEMTRLPLAAVLIGAIAMLMLGQAAVFAPARRAANVPPVVATRA